MSRVDLIIIIVAVISVLAILGVRGRRLGTPKVERRPPDERKGID